MDCNSDVEIPGSEQNLMFDVADLPPEESVELLRCLDASTLQTWSRLSVTIFTRCVNDPVLSARLGVFPPRDADSGHAARSVAEPQTRKKKKQPESAAAARATPSLSSPHSHGAARGRPDAAPRAMASVPRAMASTPRRDGAYHARLGRLAPIVRSPQQSPIRIPVLLSLQNCTCTCERAMAVCGAHFFACPLREMVERVAALPEHECIMNLRALDSKALWEWSSLHPTIYNRCMVDSTLNSRMQANKPGRELEGATTSPMRRAVTHRSSPARSAEAGSSLPIPPTTPIRPVVDGKLPTPMNVARVVKHQEMMAQRPWGSPRAVNSSPLRTPEASRSSLQMIPTSLDPRELMPFGDKPYSSKTRLRL